MTNDRLRQALRSLPRVSTSPGFRAETLSRWERRATRRTARWGWALAAAALVAGCAGLGLWRAERVRAAASVRAELQLLRARHQQLASELTTLREQAPLADTVFYVGGNDRLEFVYDAQRAAARLSRARPAPAVVRTPTPQR